MAKRENYQRANEITVEVNGESYSGSYTSRNGILRVESPFGNGVIEDKTGQGDFWAKQRLRELIRHGLSDKR